MANLILNQSQAEAVYSAMCALNNVCGKVKCSFGDYSQTGIGVFEEKSGNVRIVWVRLYDVLASEDYASQAEFATAYNLQQG